MLRIRDENLEQLFYEKLPQGSKEVLESLSDYLKKVIMSRMFKDENLPDLSLLFQLLLVEGSERQQIIKEKKGIDLSPYRTEPYCLVALIFNICPIDNLVSDYAVYAMDKVINYDLANAIVEYANKRNRGGYKLNNFLHLDLFELVENGVVNFYSLDINKQEDLLFGKRILDKVQVLTHECVKSILEILTLQEFCEFQGINENNIEFLLELISLPEIDKEQRKKIRTLPWLLTANGVAAIRENLLTLDQVKKFSSSKSILSDIGLYYLRNKYFTAEDAIEMSLIQDWQGSNLDLICLPQGKEAFTLGLINIDDAKKYPLTFLKSFEVKTIFSAMSEGLVTLQQVVSMPEHVISYLFKPQGMLVLKKKLFSPEQVAGISIDNLSMLFSSVNPDIITALELKLITPEDFVGGGKYTKIRSKDFPGEVEALIDEYMQKNYGDKKENIIAIQSQCRKLYSESKLGLFQNINSLLSTPHKVNINNLHGLNEILLQTESGKVADASEKMRKFM